MYPLLKNSTLDFGSSIYGFEELGQYKFEEMDSTNAFCLLKSVEDDNIGFVVISPFEVNPTYEFKLSEETIQELGIEQADDVLVLSIITIQRPFEQSTVNLLAPLVVNIRTGAGRQVVLNGVPYSVNTPLFPQRNVGDL
jgi:flagellar assembly factor FliW